MISSERGGARSAWSRAGLNLSYLVQPPPAEPLPDIPDEETPWVADQPGIAFHAAFATTMLGLARRPFGLRETARLAGSLGRDPRRLLGPLGGLAGEMSRIATGRSELEPGRADRRYGDAAWRGNPLFRALAQAHAATASAMDGVLDRAQLDPATDYRLRLASVNVAAALSPANFPLLNPGAIKAMIDTGGASLVTGARRARHDLAAPPHLPARSEPHDFRLGDELAPTPGAVVLRTPLMELIQYETQTATVAREPLLIVPSLVNKYYLTDLSSGRSLVEFAVANELQTFHISWVNPGEEHRDLGLDEYIASIVEALDAVREITGAPQAHTLGVCAGGQLLTVALAHLARARRRRDVASMTLTVAVLDHDDPTSPTALVTPEMARAAMARIDRDGLVDGRRLATSLAWLRPVDSIWWAWVQRYLLALDIPRLDLFHWSEDTTNLPAALVRDLIPITLENRLKTPDAVTVLDRPVDLRRVKVPAYVIAGLTDNLTPWRSCYRTTRMIGSRACFVLVTGGHLQAILRPPGGRSAGFRTSPATPSDPDEWLRGSTARDASWWDHWIRWMRRRSSGTRPAPDELGDDAHPVLEPAPGTYVRRRLDGAVQ